MSSDHEKKNATGAQAEGAAGQEVPRSPAEDLARIQTLERENADLKDRLLRALAEMENLRRRTERELQDQRAYSITKFATDIVGTADNLRRALDAVRRRGETVPDALLAHLVPLGWQHINLTGDYLWEADNLPAAEEFRQLRQLPVAPPEAAAA